MRDPFEWDVKRLAASLVVAGRVADMSGPHFRDLARVAAKNYRTRLAHFAGLAPFDAWNTRVDLGAPLDGIDSPKLHRKLHKRLDAVLAAGQEHFGLVEATNGHWRIKDKPPLVLHLSKHELHAHKAFASYGETLQEDRRGSKIGVFKLLGSVGLIEATLAPVKRDPGCGRSARRTSCSFQLASRPSGNRGSRLVRRRAAGRYHPRPAAG